MHRRRRIIGQVLHLPMSPPANLVIDWTPKGISRRWGRPKQTWREICKKWVSVAVTLMKPGALPVIVLNGDNSLPSVPVGRGEPKSKYIQFTADRLLLY